MDMVLPFVLRLKAFPALRYTIRGRPLLPRKARDKPHPGAPKPAIGAGGFRARRAAVAQCPTTRGEMAIYLWAASAYMLGVDALMMPNSRETRQIRLKRLKFRSWHRGTQEMDLLLGRFADAQLETLSDRELDLYEAVLNQADQDLYAWITGERPWPTSLTNPLTGRLTSMTAKASGDGAATR